MPDARCPTCHSKIGTDSLTEAGRTQGSQGTDSLGFPVPRWSDDPLYTALGFSGATYAGQSNRPRFSHIKEIQEARIQQEEEAGLPTPQFSDVEEDGKVMRRHVIELRESTERLLDVAGLTLQDYFSQDEQGAAQTQNPNVGTSPQTEWIDVERGAVYVNNAGQEVSTFALPSGETQQSPTVPASTKIRAIHIEDLRHPVSFGASVILVSGGSVRIADLNFTNLYYGTTYKGRKVAQANFKQVGAV